MSELSAHVLNLESDVKRVRVRAPARLHLGFIDLNGELGRRYSSIGLAITGFDAVVYASRATALKVQGLEVTRTQALLARLQQARTRVLNVAVNVEQAPPVHAGLGSGTQLGLAVATACLRANDEIASPRVLAPLIGRGARSGIGIAVFEHGGLVVDGGHGAMTEVAPIVTRLEFPARWQVLLVMDEHAQGLSGAHEQSAFKTLPPMMPAIASELARWCLVRMLPAVAEADFDGFTESVAEIQHRVGTYFATAQGGSAFASHKVEQALAILSSEFEMRGIGQSSWGPTGFVFAPTAAVAHAMREFGEHELAASSGLKFVVVAASNQGATINMDSEAPKGSA